MFNRIPTVLRSQEIIDKSFLKASKITEPYHFKLEDKIRKEIIDRVSTIEAITCGHLNKIVKKFPSIWNVHPFYRELVDLLFDIDAYKLSLGNVNWASKRIVELSTDIIGRLKRTREATRLTKLMNEYYGRYSSMLKAIDKDLSFLGKCRDEMRKIPDIDPDMHTFIIAGMPNVGKSSLLGRITGNVVRVAPYPFTTQNISVGYTLIGNERIQLIDTPGILDRPMKDRNQMEMKAVLALRHIKGIIIFLLDPSGHAGYSLEQQRLLLHEVSEILSERVIPVQAKSDLTEERVCDIAVSASTGQGIEDLKHLMEEFLDGEVHTQEGN
ncbi:MAG: 50S ribosome-binding GTPase [Candidatus Thermoplasmatota archaeon]|nr:50S ribosome-binding GTPase [Candidatus Thermoplasmatota archaeon]